MGLSLNPFSEDLEFFELRREHNRIFSESWSWYEREQTKVRDDARATETPTTTPSKDVGILETNTP